MGHPHSRISLPDPLPADASPDERRRVFSLLKQRLGGSTPATGTPNRLSTGLATLDTSLGGGFPRNALSELIQPAPSMGGQLLLHGLLETTRCERTFTALIDGPDSFDPQTTPVRLLEHLLWIRCRSALQALQAADLLLRDENFPHLIIDLRFPDPRALRGLRQTLWIRLHQLTRQSPGICLALTPRPLVPRADLRARLENRWSIEACDTARPRLATTVDATVTHDRLVRPGDEDEVATDLHARAG